MNQPVVRFKHRPDCEYYKKTIPPAICALNNTIVFGFDLSDIGASKIAWFDIEPPDANAEEYVITEFRIGLYNQLAGDPIPLNIFLQLLDLAPGDMSFCSFKFDTIASGNIVQISLRRTSDNGKFSAIGLSLTVFCPIKKV